MCVCSHKRYVAHPPFSLLPLFTHPTSLSSLPPRHTLFLPPPFPLLSLSPLPPPSQLNSSGLVSRYLQNPLKFVLSTDSAQFNHNVTVSWAIPKDEATHQDWIGQLLSLVSCPDPTQLTRGEGVWCHKSKSLG